MNIFLIILIAFVLICVISIIMCDTVISISRYKLKNNKVADSKKIKILQLSDLHSKSFGKNNKKLVKKIFNEKPDLIVMTGDMINGIPKDITFLDNFVKAIYNKLKDVVIYYVMGNREFLLNKNDYMNLVKILKNNKVYVLQNENISVSIKGQKLVIHGVNYNMRDVDEYYENQYMKNLENNNKKLADITGKLNESDYNILLIHDPMNFEEYVKNGFDLVFAGHIHGGVIRIPGIAGVLSPYFTFFPKYSKGMYNKNNTHMCVSAGLGYGTIPFRLFNLPHIICVEVK